MQHFSDSGSSNVNSGGEFSQRDENQSSVRGEVALWRAVITQALMDAASHSPKVEARHEKRRATHWLLSAGEDFRMVCHYAELDPGYVIMRVKQALARDCQWRAPATPRSKAAVISLPVIRSEIAKPEPRGRSLLMQDAICCIA